MKIELRNKLYGKYNYIVNIIYQNTFRGFSVLNILNKDDIIQYLNLGLILAIDKTIEKNKFDDVRYIYLKTKYLTFTILRDCKFYKNKHIDKSIPFSNDLLSLLKKIECDEDLDSKILLKQVLTYVYKLELHLRQKFMLKFIYDLTYLEIAEIFGVCEATIYNHISKIRKELKDVFCG